MSSRIISFCEFISVFHPGCKLIIESCLSQYAQQGEGCATFLILFSIFSKNLLDKVKIWDTSLLLTNLFDLEKEIESIFTNSELCFFEFNSINQLEKLIKTSLITQINFIHVPILVELIKNILFNLFSIENIKTEEERNGEFFLKYSKNTKKIKYNDVVWIKILENKLVNYKIYQSLAITRGKLYSFGKNIKATNIQYVIDGAYCILFNGKFNEFSFHVNIFDSLPRGFSYVFYSTEEIPSSFLIQFNHENIHLIGSLHFNDLISIQNLSNSSIFYSVIISFAIFIGLFANS